MSKIGALAKYLNIAIPIPSDEYALVDEDDNETEQDFSEYESIEETYTDHFEVNGSTYMVLTDHEADQRADDYLDESVDELVSAMTEDMDKRLAQTLESYFDYDSWKRDILLNDGRGFLASYDGDENEVFYNGNLYLIYQMD